MRSALYGRGSSKAEKTFEFKCMDVRSPILSF